MICKLGFHMIGVGSGRVGSGRVESNRIGLMHDNPILRAGRFGSRAG